MAGIVELSTDPKGRRQFYYAGRKSLKFCAAMLKFQRFPAQPSELTTGPFKHNNQKWTFILKTLHRLTIFSALLCLLTSCTGVSIASTGAQAVYNRYTLSETLNDHYITLQAYRHIYSETNQFKNTSVSIDTYHSEVLLTGEVNTPQQRKEIEQIVKHIENVDAVHNEIVVTPTVSTLTSASDAWITAKIKTKLLAINDVDASQIKVVTENGHVFLMGVIPPDQATTAIQVAQETDGVQKVTKFFSYIRITKS